MKAKAKFNIIDILLIIIILAAAAAAVYILRNGAAASNQPNAEREIQYTVLLTNVKSRFRNNIQIGDSVTDTVKLMPIGEVTDIKAAQSTVQLEDYSEGRVVTAAIPDTYDITVTVTATATLSGGFYMIGGYQINVGTLVSLRVPDYTGTGYCTSITEAQ